VDNFAVLILTHGRPDKVYTYSAIRKYGYTGPIYLICDNLDKTIDQYRAKYGDQVIVFDKPKIAAELDQGDNFNDLRSTLYVRSAMFEIARTIPGLKYFIQLDDDYTAFNSRFTRSRTYYASPLKSLDETFMIMTEFLESTNSLAVCMAQGGDFIGGGSGSFGDKISIYRKAMNSFLCSVERPFKFLGRMNEDVNTYIRLGFVGELFFTTNQVSLTQKQTQTTSGGMTELYKKYGTYVKSFYSVMYMPSSVKVSMIRGQKFSRIHHAVSANNTYPKILRETVKKS